MILLGWLGSGGGDSSDPSAPVDASGGKTDLVAHAGGFVIGALLGAAAAVPRVRRVLERVPQWLAGAIALAAFARLVDRFAG